MVSWINRLLSFTHNDVTLKYYSDTPQAEKGYLLVHIYKGRKRERESGLKEDENNYKSDDIYVSGIALGHGFKEV